MVIDLHISFVVGLAFEQNDIPEYIRFFMSDGCLFIRSFHCSDISSAQLNSTIPKSTHTSLIMFTSAIVIPLK